MDNWGYLVAAYSVVWLAIFGFVSILYRRHRQLWREIDSLKARVRDRGDD
jgi:CcmD family protein